MQDIEKAEQPTPREPTNQPEAPSKSGTLMQRLLRTLRPARQPDPEASLQELARSDGRTEEERLFNWDRPQPPTRDEVLTFFREYQPSRNVKKPFSIYDFCARENQWEIVTKDLVDGLINYFETRKNELHKSAQDPLTIVEVGAGKGLMAHFIAKALKERGLSDVIRYIATEKRIPSHKEKMNPNGKINLEVLYGIDYRDALDPAKIDELNGHPPDMVIASWPAPRSNRYSEYQPEELDWTLEFRKRNAGEYMLIGDPYVCAYPWDSWGVMAKLNPTTLSLDMDKTKKAAAEYEKKLTEGTLRSEERPLYERDGRGYQKIEVPSLQAIQHLGATDDYTSNERSLSRIATFRKVT